MPSFRQSMIAIGDAVYKNVLGPLGLDLTPYQLTIKTRTWPGERGDTSVGQPVDGPILVLGQWYPVRLLSIREIAGSAGVYREGDVIVEQISPPGAGGVGYSSAQLRPATTSDRVEIVYALSGDPGLSGNYGLRQAQFDDWQYYNLILCDRRDTP